MYFDKINALPITLIRPYYHVLLRHVMSGLSQSLIRSQNVMERRGPLPLSFSGGLLGCWDGDEVIVMS